MSKILQEICQKRLAQLVQEKQTISEQDLLTQAQAADAPRGFERALRAAKRAGRTGLICELKKASPSQGVIRADFDVPSLAQAYAQGGATCLSVLTEPDYFQGQDVFIAQAHAACQLPILRKDFMLDPYQILQARALGADCVLLILSALSIEQAMLLEATAQSLGMDVLIEAHNETELEYACARLHSTLIGINNRNLKTLEIDTGITARLAPMLPEEYLVVCESGINTRADIEAMQAANVHSFLIGTSLMRQNDVRAATQALMM